MEAIADAGDTLLQDIGETAHAYLRHIRGLQRKHDDAEALFGDCPIFLEDGSATVALADHAHEDTRAELLWFKHLLSRVRTYRVE